MVILCILYKSNWPSGSKLTYDPDFPRSSIASDTSSAKKLLLCKAEVTEKMRWSAVKFWCKSTPFFHHNCIHKAKCTFVIFIFRNCAVWVRGAKAILPSLNKQFTACAEFIYFYICLHVLSNFLIRQKKNRQTKMLVFNRVMSE